jgi:hypothetical protein
MIGCAIIYVASCVCSTFFIILGQGPGSEDMIVTFSSESEVDVKSYTFVIHRTKLTCKEDKPRRFSGWYNRNPTYFEILSSV